VKHPPMHYKRCLNDKKYFNISFYNYEHGSNIKF